MTSLWFWRQACRSRHRYMPPRERPSAVFVERDSSLGSRGEDGISQRSVFGAPSNLVVIGVLNGIPCDVYIVVRVRGLCELQARGLCGHSPNLHSCGNAVIAQYGGAGVIIAGFYAYLIFPQRRNDDRIMSTVRDASGPCVPTYAGVQEDAPLRRKKTSYRMPVLSRGEASHETDRVLSPWYSALTLDGLPGDTTSESARTGCI